MKNKYEGIGDSVELYYTFKDEFFGYISEKIVESELAAFIIEAYNDYEFYRVRRLIEDEVDDKTDVVMLNALNNVVDEVDTLAYKRWKELDNMYTEFYEVYSELIELNLI